MSNYWLSEFKIGGVDCLALDGVNIPSANTNLVTAEISYEHYTGLVGVKILPKTGYENYTIMYKEIYRGGGWWEYNYSANPYGNNFNNFSYPMDMTVLLIWITNGTETQYFGVKFVVDKNIETGHKTQVPSGYTGIYTVADLDNIRNNLNGKYILMNDLDMSGVNWVPISQFNYFVGVFDGNNHKIQNLSVGAQGTSKSERTYLSLFGDVEAATFLNVKMTNFEITGGYDYCGGLVGQASTAVLKNCHVSGKVVCAPDAREGFGGLVGNSINVRFYYCSSDVELICVEGVYSCGGLVGMAYSEGSHFEKCWSEGSILGYDDFGGLIGGADDVIVINCYSIVNMTTLNNGDLVYAGGLLGYAFGNSRIENSYAAGNVPTSTEANAETGGLLGFTQGVVVNCYYDSETTGQPDNGLGTPKTTAEMMQQATFENWEFGTVWLIKENVDYPRIGLGFIECTAFPLAALKVNVIN